MITTLERPTDIQALAPAKAPFTINRLKNLRAPRPLLGHEADLSLVGGTLLDWYWHGTSVSNLPSILEHGLLPDKTMHYHRTCLAARSHVAFFWGRLYAAIGNTITDVALIRIPGRMLREADLGIERGSLESGAYGHKRSDIALASKQTWDPANWRRFQATFGCVSTSQPITVTAEMVVVCPMLPNETTMSVSIQEWAEGNPVTA